MGPSQPFTGSGAAWLYSTMLLAVLPAMSWESYLVPRLLYPFRRNRYSADDHEEVSPVFDNRLVYYAAAFGLIILLRYSTSSAAVSLRQSIIYPPLLRF